MTPPTADEFRAESVDMANRKERALRRWCARFGAGDERRVLFMLDAINLHRVAAEMADEIAELIERYGRSA